MLLFNSLYGNLYALFLKYNNSLVYSGPLVGRGKKSQISRDFQGQIRGKKRPISWEFRGNF